MKATLTIVAFLLFFSCASTKEVHYQYKGNTISSWDIEYLKNNLRSYGEVQPPEFRVYQEYYQLDFCEKENLQAGLLSRLHYPYDIFVQSFRQPDAVGQIILIHGYLDHTGLNHRALRFFYDLGWDVVAVDLPGHGLSTGERAHIDDFDHYGTMLDMVLQEVTPPSKGPRVALGHSTGGAAIMNYLLNNGTRSLDAGILVAPLVQPQAWYLAKAGTVILGWLLPRVPNTGGFATSSQEHWDLMTKHDAMRIDSIAISWVKATGDWIETFEAETDRRDFPFLLVQGTRDHVVDPEYNLPEILRIFPETEVVWIEEGYHSLLNEPEEKRVFVYEAMESFLVELSGELP